MPPSAIQQLTERFRAEAQRLLQSYIGSRPGRDVQPVRFDLYERGPDRKAVLMASVVWEAVLAAKRLPTVTPPETRPEF